MAPTHDYDETRRCLIRALERLDRLRQAAGRTNLPPAMPPDAIRRQIDDLDGMVAEVVAELAEARAACVRAGRRGLQVFG